MLTSKRKNTQTKIMQNTNTDSNDSTNFIDQLKKECEDDEKDLYFTNDTNIPIDEFASDEQINYDPTSSFYASENNVEVNTKKKKKQAELEIKHFRDEKSHRINYTDGKARNKSNVKGQATGQKHRKGQVPIEYIENPLLRASTKHKRSLTLLKKVNI